MTSAIVTRDRPEVTPQCAEKLDPFSLPSVAYKDKKHLPSASGIYFVIRRKAIIYIGRSVNIKERWGRHHVRSALYKLDGVRIATWQLPEVQLESAERDLIDMYQPRLNQQIAEQFDCSEIDTERRLAVMVQPDLSCPFTEYMLGGVATRIYLDALPHIGEEISLVGPLGRAANFMVTRVVHSPYKIHGISQCIRVKPSWDDVTRKVYDSEFATKDTHPTRALHRR